MRLHVALHGFNHRTAFPSLAERVIRVTNRYSRRFGGVRTVADWQKLAFEIAGRAEFDHKSTLRALVDIGYRSKSLISLEKLNCNEFVFPSPKWALYEIKERAGRINAARLERLRQERERFLCSCAVCGQESTHPKWPVSHVRGMDSARVLEISGLLPLVQRYRATGAPIPFCFSHGMQFSRILRRTERLQEQRININRLKKDLRSEATKNHA